jgi:phage host-nuclease inhibitor protein Gam
MNEEDLVYRLRKRAEIRRQIPTRKSVQENAPDRIADLLDEAALEIEYLKCEIESLKKDLSEYSFYAS